MTLQKARLRTQPALLYSQSDHGVAMVNGAQMQIVFPCIACSQEIFIAYVEMHI